LAETIEEASFIPPDATCNFVADERPPALFRVLVCLVKVSFWRVEVAAVCDFNGWAGANRVAV